MNSKPAIVFVHGLIRPPSLASYSFEYFKGIKKALSDLPVSLHFPNLPAGASIQSRADALSKSIRAIDAKTIYLIGHSMGGLDCRYYAHHHPEDQSIKRITTVATPHRGSPLADWTIHSRSPVAMMARYLYGDGIKELSCHACENFNRHITDRSDVEYHSYAAVRPDWELPFWLWLLFSRHMGKQAGDGQVTASSARWGHFAGLIHADHLEASGWSLALPSQAELRPFHHIDFYRRLINDFIATQLSHSKLQEQHHERSNHIGE